MPRRSAIGKLHISSSRAFTMPRTLKHPSSSTCGSSVQARINGAQSNGLGLGCRGSELTDFSGLRDLEGLTVGPQ